MRLPKAAWPIIIYARKTWRLHKAKQSFRKAAQIEQCPLVAFTCNICGEHGKAPASFIAREHVSCVYCGSTMRYRAMVQALILGLYRNNIALPKITPDFNKRGIGVSDARDYAEPLAKVFNYTNTFYHQEPFLDVTADNAHYRDSLDFIMISDVLEHVCPPIEKAFAGLHAMLKSGGVCIITVPCTDDGDDVEHYPELNDFNISQVDGNFVITNTTAAGIKQEFHNPVFHGGAGLTLEMRIFSRASLLAQLKAAGFVDVEVLDQDSAEFGIIWKEDRSVPVIARKAS